MTERAPPPPQADRDLHELDDRIARFARRRAHARSRRGRSLWAQATAVGTLGWLIAVPIVLGALLGHLLDLYLGSGITWAMAFMFLGVLIAGYSLWKLSFDTLGDEGQEQRASESTAEHQERGGAAP
ncbi:AtpZ/AtpI family protein [Paraliomyxa miuraensis]|uniref:AtpZ/AtpI family protein n=1 Tax=Paraliomyxa miuraensis TaxID=376150 RepID=UPI002254BBCE|nr:AtpZ/AtpI family protein [Paraliomyxa miuraensis]MCX4244897.1 AtpZ/AtpI family protein [Paraliomyxa miuraensis]